jgi:ATP-dependent Clp protease ATP-binding subunit ClpA
MFERFTAPAREVVVRAQEEASTLGHPAIGSEHLLLALIDERAGASSALLREAGLDQERVRGEVAKLVASPFGPEDAEALRGVGVDLDAVRARITESFGPGALESVRPPARRGLLRRRTSLRGHLPFSGPAKKSLELSLREATSRHDNSIGSEHVLLGVLRQGGGGVAVLTGLGVDIEALRSNAQAALDRAA